MEAGIIVETRSTTGRHEGARSLGSLLPEQFVLITEQYIYIDTTG